MPHEFGGRYLRVARRPFHGLPISYHRAQLLEVALQRFSAFFPSKRPSNSCGQVVEAKEPVRGALLLLRFEQAQVQGGRPLEGHLDGRNAERFEVEDQLLVVVSDVSCAG